MSDDHDTVDVSEFDSEPPHQTTEMFGEYYPVVEDTWHLSDWKEPHPPIKDYWHYDDLDFSEEGMNVCVKLPLEYEEIVDGVNIKVEFFQETYPVFSFIQARITVTNQSDEVIGFHEGHKKAAGVFLKNGIVGKGAHTSPDYDFDTGAADTVMLNKGESFVGEVVYFATNEFFKIGDDKYEYQIEVLSMLKDEYETYSIAFPVEVIPIK